MQVSSAIAGGRVVHVVGRLRDGAAGRLLWPTLLTLAEAGLQQVLVLLDRDDEPTARQLLPRDTALEVLPRASASWGRVAPAAVTSLRRWLQADAVLALHLHGEAGARWGGRLLRTHDAAVPVFLHEVSSPARRVSWWRRAVSRPRWPLAFIVRDGRVEPCSGGASAPATALETFLRLRRAEGEHPVVVATGRRNDFAAASAFAQLAVLFVGSAPAVRFVWLGEAGPAVAAVLQAAQVQQQRARRPAERAGWLAQAWLYVAPGGLDHESRGLMEAMAAGVPCVARDRTTLADRLIIDQLSGFVCGDQQAVLARVAQLIDQPVLRRQIGSAARHRAQLHHGDDRFRARLLLAHGLPVDGQGVAATTAGPQPTPAE